MKIKKLPDNSINMKRPKPSTIDRIIKASLKKYECDPQKLINDYKNNHLQSSVICDRDIIDDTILHNIRQDILNKLVKYSATLYNINGKDIRLLYDYKVHSAIDYHVHFVVASVLINKRTIFAPIFWGYRNNIDLYPSIRFYFACDNTLYLFNDNYKDNVFENIARKNNNIDDSITEFNYFNNSKRIRTVARLSL